MRYIILTNGGKTKVDDSDYEVLSKFKWYKSNSGYAMRSIFKDNRPQSVLMHREILATPRSKQTDHINRDRLDNRKVNLRVVNTLENASNTRPRLYKNDSSKYKGVSWFKKDRTWRARINRQAIGYFKSEKLAALAYDLWAINTSPNAFTNFSVVAYG